ncbi:hypothetical protein FZN21_17140 [Escherichia coli]|nr:hypothetical protein [Escherichia coli]NAQ00962.1 hypothetical protein [Escherichia coli]
MRRWQRRSNFYSGGLGVFASSAALYTMPDATLTRPIMPTNHIAHFSNLSFIPYSSTSAIIDFQLNHHLMNKNNDQT